MISGSYVDQFHFLKLSSKSARVFKNNFISVTLMRNAETNSQNNLFKKKNFLQFELSYVKKKTPSIFFHFCKRRKFWTLSSKYGEIVEVANSNFKKKSVKLPHHGE